MLDYDLTDDDSDLLGKGSEINSDEEINESENFSLNLCNEDNEAILIQTL